MESCYLGIRGSIIGLLTGIVVSEIVIIIFGWPDVYNIILYIFPFLVGFVMSVLAGNIAAKKTKNIDINILMNE